MSISTREAKQSYHPKGYGVSEGLKRARAPFRTRNAIVGLGLSGFMFSVYLYSIRAVAQDDFADLQPPTEEQRRNTISIEEERRNREALKGQTLDIASPSRSTPLDVPAQSPSLHTGILGRLRGTFGGKGTESQIVYNAPPVDNIGRIGGVEPVQVQRRIV
ncbi:uncharacterized protein JCM6883_004958 [Sporobolomyces salmoneus]|uniref:uncharacterized protein n=1 Tax=Sporobolomyces salmoneus TaxID=183962 RepID=UPI00318045DE